MIGDTASLVLCVSAAVIAGHYRFGPRRRNGYVAFWAVMTLMYAGVVLTSIWK